MRILCYGAPDACHSWRQLLVDAGMAPMITYCEPPDPPHALLRQSWDVALAERGHEEGVLSLLPKAMHWQAAVPPVYVLGGDAGPDVVSELLLRGATAVLAQRELGCLPQMLRQQAQLDYLGMLIEQPSSTRIAGDGAVPDDDSDPDRRAQELDNQIMSISLYAELLLERLGHDAEAVADLEAVLAAASRASSLARLLRTSLTQPLTSV